MPEKNPPLTIEDLENPQLHRLLVLDSTVRSLSVQTETVRAAITQIVDLIAENKKQANRIQELEALVSRR